MVHKHNCKIISVICNIICVFILNRGIISSKNNAMINPKTEYSIVYCIISKNLISLILSWFINFRILTTECFSFSF